MRWVKQYETDGEITGYERKPIATKVRKDHVDFLINEIKKRKTITMEDLLVKLKKTYPDADITRQHLTRVARDNNITPLWRAKKSHFRASEENGMRNVDKMRR